MRLRYAIAPPWIAEQYRRVAPMFSISSSPSLAAGTAALADLEWMRDCVKRIVSERERVKAKLPCAPPSQANFLFPANSLQFKGLSPAAALARDNRPGLQLLSWLRRKMPAGHSGPAEGERSLSSGTGEAWRKSNMKMAANDASTG